MRYKQHLIDSKKRKTYSNIWINNLLNDGLKPTVEIIDKCNDNWVEVEKKWIIEIYENNKKLTNLTYIEDVEDRNPEYTINGNIKNSYNELKKLYTLGFDRKTLSSLYGDDYKKFRNDFIKKNNSKHKNSWYKLNNHLFEISKLITDKDDLSKLIKQILNNKPKKVIKNKYKSLYTQINEYKKNSLEIVNMYSDKELSTDKRIEYYTQLFNEIKNMLNKN